jgi:hypothetical protein
MTITRANKVYDMCIDQLRLERYRRPKDNIYKASTRQLAILNSYLSFSEPRLTIAQDYVLDKLKGFLTYEVALVERDTAHKIQSLIFFSHGSGLYDIELSIP